MQVAVTLSGPAASRLLEHQVEFHLAVGADIVVAAAEAADFSLGWQSRVGAGVLLIAPADGGDAHLSAAACEAGADWILRTPAAGFWWPRGGSLHEVLEPLPQRYRSVLAVQRRFVRQADGNGADFGERLMLRDTRAELAHEDSVFSATRAGDGPGVRLVGWRPLEILCFPPAGSPGPRLAAEELAARTRDGTLVLDTRLRDAFRALRGLPVAGFSLEGSPPHLRLPRPTVADEAAYALEVAELEPVDPAEVVSGVITELERRIAALERPDWRTRAARLRPRLRRTL